MPTPMRSVFWSVKPDKLFYRKGPKLIQTGPERLYLLEGRGLNRFPIKVLGNKAITSFTFPLRPLRL